jgi:hypothetical protein
MSRGYTIAFARTAPVAPATALPHGGSGAAFVEGAILLFEAQCLLCSLAGSACDDRSFERRKRIGFLWRQ